MILEKNIVERIEYYIENKIIRSQKHPDRQFKIYNYTQKAQYDKIWDEVTMMCRGLIIDHSNGQWEVMSRPFKKFFNLEELEKVQHGEFTAEEKMDGSLGILYWDGSVPYIATRGSFTSEQAIVANVYLRDLHLGLRDFDRTQTYLFEIIYPENRVVVDYKGFQGLVYLGGIKTATGKPEWDESMRSIFRTPHRAPAPVSVFDLKKTYEKENQEGFVITWLDGEKAKVKYDEYVRLHRIITGVNERRVWEILKENESLDYWLEKVPDEFYKFVKETANGLLEKFTVIKKTCEYYKIRSERVDGNNGREFRKNQALYLKDKCPDRASIVFAMIDQKDYHQKIWKMIKPESTPPFYNKNYKEEV